MAHVTLESNGVRRKFGLHNGKVQVADVLRRFQAAVVEFEDQDWILVELTADLQGFSTDSFEDGSSVKVTCVPVVASMPALTGGSSRNLVPFADVVCDFTLPFKGRDGVMEEIANIIDANFTTFVSSGISKEQVLFIAIEGLAGVGKTRILLEAKGQVGKALKLKRTKLAQVHACGAAAAVYITFNGCAVGHSEPHFLPPGFLKMCRDRGANYAGRIFMRSCLVSQILYGKPWGCLPSGLQDEILAEDDLASLQKISAHVRKGLGIAQSDQMVALYLLVDESQQLGREVSKAGCDALDFVRGMFAWIVTVMATSVARECNIAFITLLAGTVLPVGGRYGVFDWLNVPITVHPLDLNSALEVLRLSVKDDHFEEFSTQVKVLLEDCNCLPRLITYIYSAWVHAMDSELPAQDVIAYLRTSVTRELTKWIDPILTGNTDNVKRMVRLCLTGAVMEKPPVGQWTWEKEACFNGYVYAEEVPGGVIYRSPMLLIHALGLKFGIPERIVALRPQLAEADVLEDAFLDMLHARLCVFEGQMLSLGKIFEGAMGGQDLLDTKVNVDARGNGVVEEGFEFYYPNDKKFYYPDDRQMVGMNGNRYVHPTEKQPRNAGFVFKCKKGAVVTDGRVFLIGADGKVYEIWLQLKGQKARVSMKEAEKWAKAAHSKELQVEGRKKVYVLCSRTGFSSKNSISCEGDVLLLDLDDFMPEFIRRCQL